MSGTEATEKIEEVADQIEEVETELEEAKESGDPAWTKALLAELTGLRSDFQTLTQSVLQSQQAPKAEPEPEAEKPLTVESSNDDAADLEKTQEPIPIRGRNPKRLQLKKRRL